MQKKRAKHPWAKADKVYKVVGGEKTKNLLLGYNKGTEHIVTKVCFYKFALIRGVDTQNLFRIMHCRDFYHAELKQIFCVNPPYQSKLIKKSLKYIMGVHTTIK